MKTALTVPTRTPLKVTRLPRERPLAEPGIWNWTGTISARSPAPLVQKTNPKAARIRTMVKIPTAT